MKKILDFSQFLTESNSKSLVINENKKDQSLVISQKKLMNYIDRTDNKGGNYDLAEKTADEILKNGAEDCLNLFLKGAPSVCYVDILEMVISKIGLLDKNISSGALQSILEKTRPLLENDFPDLIKEWDLNGGFREFQDISDQDGEVINGKTIMRIRENLKNSSLVLNKISSLKNILEARDSDSIKNLKESETDLLKVIFSNSIKDYKTASKIKSQIPNFYAECSELIGNDEPNISSSLGSFGF